jgi:hypothetical protein
MNGDVSARRMVGWLLRSNRLLGTADPALRSGKEFARLFRCRDERAMAASQITRWEHGEIAATRLVIRRYEHMLDLRPDSLLTLSDALHRAERAPSTGNRQPQLPDEDVLFPLLRRADHGDPLTGLEWAQLAENIQAAPGLYVYPEIWATISGRLLDELVVSDHTEWLLRQEAMSKLLEHPNAGRHAVRQCIELVTDPSSPAVLEPMSLLDVTALPVANTYVLGQLTDPDNDPALRAAVQTIRQKLLRGHLTAEQRRAAHRAVSARIEDGESSALLPDLRELSALASTPATHGDSAVAHPHRLHESSQRVALQAQAKLSDSADDDVLPHVVEQALFSPSFDGRMFAAMCLAATPYRVPVAEAVVTEVQADLARRTDAITSTALRTLTTMAVDVHRPLLQQILTGQGFSMAVREAAAWALPHCVGRFPKPVWHDILGRYATAWRYTRSLGSGRILHAVAYGIGTDGYRDLAESIRSEPALPLQARRTAAWLLRSRPHVST